MTVRIAPYFFCISLSAIIFGCGIDQEEYYRLAQEEYLRKAEILRTERLELCRKDVDLQAEIIADSIIQKMNLDPLEESQYRPSAPPRPEYVPTDSQTVNSKRSVKPLVDSLTNKR